eukprot:g4986.t1
MEPLHDPDDPARLRGLQLLRTLDTPDEPADLADALARACPQLMRVQELMGDARDALARGDRRKAVKIAKKAVALDPFHVPARGELAVMLRARAGAGDNTKALAELRRCIKRLDHDLGPDERARRYAPIVICQVYRNTGNALVGMQDPAQYAEALTLFRKAIALVPTEEGPYHGISRVLFQMRRMKELCEHRKRTAAAFPGSALANYNYASSLEEQGAGAAEIAKFYGLAWMCARNDPSASRDPDYPVAAARQWVRLGMLDKAQKGIDAALAIDPTHEPALRLKMSVLSVAANAATGHGQAPPASWASQFHELAAVSATNHQVRMAQHEKRDRELGVAVDFMSLQDESRHDTFAGTPRDSMHAVISSQVAKVGAMVKIRTTSPFHRQFRSVVALVSKGLSDGRVTLQVLPGAAAAVAADASCPAHVQEVSQLRLRLAAHTDVSSVRAEEEEGGTQMGENTTAEHDGPRFVAKETTVRARPANLVSVCDFCCMPKTTGGKSVLRKCGGCKVAHYCGKRCQKAHWKIVHKKTCKKLMAAKARETAWE